MHHTPPPAPLIIQGAHFEFREPQPLPAAQTFIPNPPDRKEPELYKFWVYKDDKKVGLLTINKKSEGLGKRTNKAVFTDNIARVTKSPQMVFELAHFDIPIDAKQMLSSAYNLERDKEIATQYCLDFEQQYIEFVGSQFEYVAIPLPVVEFKAPIEAPQDEFLTKWENRPLAQCLISTEQQPETVISPTNKQKDGNITLDFVKKSPQMPIGGLCYPIKSGVVKID